MSQSVDVHDYAYYQVCWRINRLILRQLEFRNLAQEIVDVIFQELDAGKLGYALVALLVPDYQINALRRIAISKTDQAQELVSNLTTQYFEKVVNPLTDDSNVCVRSFKQGRPVVSKSWCEMLCPVVPKEEAEKVQKQVGVETILIYPLKSGQKVLGLINFNLSKSESEIDEHERLLLEGIADAAAVAIENSRMYLKLQELDRLKDEFLSLAAHELRTPMTAIKGYSSLALKAPYLQPKEKEYLERVCKSTQRLVNLVNDMLDVSRIESGRVELKMERLEIDKLIADVLTDLSPKAAEKGIKITFAPIGPGPVVVWGDSVKITQILFNLLGNAIKFTPSGGEVTVSLQTKTGYAQVNIGDTGVGIGPEDLPKLFGKFVRAKSGEGQPGTGLGLYVSRKLVTLMGGQISASSAGIGQGANFSFTIRLA